MQIDEFERQAQISVVLLGIEVQREVSAREWGLFQQVSGRRAADTLQYRLWGLKEDRDVLLLQ